MSPSLARAPNLLTNLMSFSTPTSTPITFRICWMNLLSCSILLLASPSPDSSTRWNTKLFSFSHLSSISLKALGPPESPSLTSCSFRWSISFCWLSSLESRPFSLSSILSILPECSASTFTLASTFVVRTLASLLYLAMALSQVWHFHGLSSPDAIHLMIMSNTSCERWAHWGCHHESQMQHCTAPDLLEATVLVVSLQTTQLFLDWDWVRVFPFFGTIPDALLLPPPPPAPTPEPEAPPPPAIALCPLSPH